MKDLTNDELCVMVDKLKEYISTKQDEYTEYCYSLLDLVRRTDYLPKKLQNQIIKEIKNELEYFESNFEIIEEEVIQTFSVKILKRKE